MTTVQGNVRLAFYGDDFTGSTDAMEVTAFAGLRTVLFTRVPDSALLGRFMDYDVIGVAGTSRAQDPEWMDAHLPGAFAALAQLGPRIVQYKVCSTFDSAPNIGSIGRAIDIGMREIGGRWSPSVVGAPQLGRWQAFGTLFARAGSQTYRIDRHPTMSRHPVTPMHEADLKLHLAAQTDRPVRGVDGGLLHNFTVPVPDGLAPVVFLDVFDAATQEQAGRLVWEEAMTEPLFSASSSGLQYALAAHWRSCGQLPEQAAALPPAPPAERLLVLSGSCSPVTAEQIEIAEASGFATLRLDVVAASGEHAESEIDRLSSGVAKAFAAKQGLIIFAARTVDDPAFATLRKAATERGVEFTAAQDALGRFMGRLARRLVPEFGLRRLVVAGGDTSGRVVEALPIDALEVLHPLASGAPICRCHSTNSDFSRLELVLKGGQIGQPDIFTAAL
ncbi:four-carbon acid sugar kinase family protein [Salipiger sp. PrR002]|uniref:four-carbon acid sugar kinase family protein n=1 Tax=Salipiger sp. PrR002 TaxID=2706489 RepID=UPI0034CE36A7